METVKEEETSLLLQEPESNLQESRKYKLIWTFL